MTNIKLLEKLNAIIEKHNSGNNEYITDLCKLTLQIEDEARAEKAKAGGAKKLHTYAKSIIKTLPSHTAERLSGSAFSDGLYYTCDTYRILITKNNLELPELAPENFPLKLCNDFLKQFEHLDELEPVPLPDIQELKIYIAKEKAKKAPILRYDDININNITINANFLLQAMQAGFCKCYYNKNMFYLLDDAGNYSVICGVRGAER